MKLSLVVAAGKNWAIGKDNKMPWHMPADLKYFKKTTMGKPIVMGRKTFESIGRPLPGRFNIVLTHDPNFKAEGVEVFHNMGDVCAYCEDLAVWEDFSEIMVVGGAEIYALTLPNADRVYLTQIQSEFEADAYFPALDAKQWKEVSRQDYQADDENPYDYSLLVMEPR